MSSSSSSSSNNIQEWNWKEFLHNLPTVYFEDSDLDTDDENEDECSCNSKSGFRSFVCLMSNEGCPKKENEMFHLD